MVRNATIYSSIMHMGSINFLRKVIKIERQHVCLLCQSLDIQSIIGKQEWNMEDIALYFKKNFEIDWVKHAILLERTPSSIYIDDNIINSN